MHADVLNKLLPYMADVVNQKALRHGERRNSLYVGRGSQWGNPWRIVPGGYDRLWVLDAFLRHVHTMPSQDRAVWLHPIAVSLRHGRKLRCFCAPQPCHAMILAAYARTAPEMARFWAKQEDKEVSDPRDRSRLLLLPSSSV